MKKFNYNFVLYAILCLINLSCSKSFGNADIDSDDLFIQNVTDNQTSAAGKGRLDQTVIGDLGADLTNQTFCSAKVVPICAGQTINAGEVAVQTAINGKTYITYTLKGLWYFKAIHLYAGEQAGIPVNNSGNPVPGQFPYTKTFGTPYGIQKYTFVIDGLDDAYAVAAHCSIAKIAGNGNIIQEETGWGDGCSGIKITNQGNWGTFMNYIGASCTIAAASSEQINLCSNSVDTYFWVNPSNPDALTWRNPVTVAGFTYSEEEARAIANTANPNGIPDSKYAFMRVSTIKLSGTEYQASPILLSAMQTVEDWLSDKNKLSTTNLPTGNAVVKNAATIIESWIAAHLCSIE